MKFLTVLAIFFVQSATAQSSDFITIRKNNITIKTLLSGSYQTILLAGGRWVSIKILDIKKDSIFFKEIAVRRLGTPWGVGRLDTLATPVEAVYYKDIVGIPKIKSGFEYLKNGTLPMVAGSGYILLNVINSAYLNFSPFSKKNLPGVLIAGGAIGLGFLQHKKYQKFISFGKRYTLQYVKASIN